MEILRKIIKSLFTVTVIPLEIPIPKNREERREVERYKRSIKWNKL